MLLSLLLGPLWGVGCEVLVLCLPGRLHSCLAALGSMGAILKLSCSHFLGGAVNRVYKIGAGNILGSMEHLSGRKTGISASTRGVGGGKTENSCLGSSTSIACSDGWFLVGGKRNGGSGWASSAAVGRHSPTVRLFVGGFSLSKINHISVAVQDMSNLTHFPSVTSCGWVAGGHSAEHLVPMNGLGMELVLTIEV